MRRAIASPMDPPVHGATAMRYFVVVLIALFGVLVVSLSTIFEWKIALAGLLTCPVGVVLLWLSRDTPTLDERIAGDDARRAGQRIKTPSRVTELGPPHAT